MKIKDQVKLMKNVLRGAKYLDKNEPNWYNSVDLDCFDMGNSSTCVAGWVFKDKIVDEYGSERGYEYAVNEMSLDTDRLGFEYDWSVEISMSEQYGFLGDIWLRAQTPGAA